MLQALAASNGAAKCNGTSLAPGKVSKYLSGYLRKRYCKDVAQRCHHQLQHYGFPKRQQGCWLQDLSGVSSNGC